MTWTQDHTQLFARIHIHGLTSANGEPQAITLERYISFPAPVRTQPIESLTVTDLDLSPRPLDPVFDLTARIIYSTPKVASEEYNNGPKNVLGYGLSGLVFPLELLSISPCTDPRAADLMAQLPPLCIKVAVPGFARFLAREAWFYEYLDSKGLTGVITPRCYGVFHAALGTSRSNENLKIDISGYDYYSAANKTIYYGVPLYTAPLLDDHYDISSNTLLPPKFFVDDRKRSYASSPWRLFRQDPKVTTLTVLVMDRLGDPLTLSEFDEDWDGDIQDIYEDLGQAFIYYRDDRFPNVLRVPHYAQRECKTHKCMHKWNFIDWAQASLHCDNVATSCLLRWQCQGLNDYSISLGGSYRDVRQ